MLQRDGVLHPWLESPHAGSKDADPIAFRDGTHFLDESEVILPTFLG